MSVLFLEGNSNLEPCGFCPHHWAEIQKYLISECKSKKWQIPGLFVQIHISQLWPTLYPRLPSGSTVYSTGLSKQIAMSNFFLMMSSSCMNLDITYASLWNGMSSFSQGTFKLCIIFTYPELNPGNTSHLILNEETSQMSSLQGDFSQTQLYPCAI